MQMPEESGFFIFSRDFLLAHQNNSNRSAIEQINSAAP
jgi:hypothetical protein